MCRRTHHAPLRRLPSRNGHPTQAPPSSMVGRPQTSPTASPRRLPFLLRPIKGPHDPLHPSHRSSSLPRPCSAAARGGRAGAPPLAADLLRRRLSHIFKPLGEFLAPSSSFWCNPPRVWCPGGHSWLSSGEPRRRHSHAPSGATAPTAACCCQPPPAT
jgi:hypothetical protein